MAAKTAARQTSESATPPAGEIVRARRTLITEAGEHVAYEIGELFVPENRSKPKSRRIAVGFARILSAEVGGALPTFHLAGGPGSSHLGALDPKTDGERMKQRELLAYRAVGDVIIIDQRGYSSRGEILTFTAREPGGALDRPLTPADSTAAFVRAARTAVAAEKTRDLSGYTVVECADDVDSLRRALGYHQIILVGQSFGSQWSLAVMRRHPGTVARAMLSGLEPLNEAYDMPSHVFAALQRISWDADRDRRLARYLPQDGLMEAVRAVIARFEAKPVEAEVLDGDAVRMRRVVLGLGDVQRALLRPAAAWPAIVLSLYHHHYSPLAAEVLRERLDGHCDASLIAPLIDTSLGVTGARKHQLLTDPACRFLGCWDFDAYLASTSVWPSPDVGDAFRTPVVDQTPVVFIAGDWDTATPIENMFGLLPYFPNGRAIVVHRGSHDARAILAERKSPVIDSVLQFLRSGDPAGLPVETSLSPPPFAVPAIPTFAGDPS